MRRTSLLLAVLVTGCTGPAMPAPERPERLPLEIQWSLSSAEHRAVFLQTYRHASAALDRLSTGYSAGEWAVIADADETMLDNAPFQVRLFQEEHTGFDSLWSAWVREKAALALPGAAAFAQRVHTLGGRIIVVTNRTHAQCPDTRENFAAAGLEVDLVLCADPDGGRNKSLRFRRVMDGTTGTDLPPLTVIMWLGDNITDFPALAQDLLRAAPDTAFDKFGTTYIVFPNPMYGSWTPPQ